MALQQAGAPPSPCPENSPLRHELEANAALKNDDLLAKISRMESDLSRVSEVVKDQQLVSDKMQNRVDLLYQAHVSGSKEGGCWSFSKKGTPNSPTHANSKESSEFAATFAQETSSRLANLEKQAAKWAEEQRRLDSQMQQLETGTPSFGVKTLEYKEYEESPKTLALIADVEALRTSVTNEIQEISELKRKMGDVSGEVANVLSMSGELQEANHKEFKNVHQELNELKDIVEQRMSATNVATAEVTPEAHVSPSLFSRVDAGRLERVEKDLEKLRVNLQAPTNIAPERVEGLENKLEQLSASVAKATPQAEVQVDLANARHRLHDLEGEVHKLSLKLTSPPKVEPPVSHGRMEHLEGEMLKLRSAVASIPSKVDMSVVRTSETAIVTSESPEKLEKVSEDVEQLKISVETLEGCCGENLARLELFPPELIKEEVRLEMAQIWKGIAALTAIVGGESDDNTTASLAQLADVKSIEEH